MEKSKRCRDCGVSKPRDAFHGERRSADGLRVNCKDCRNDYMAARYVVNREAILARQRSNPRDPDALSAYQRRYRKANRDRLRAKMRRWSEANPEWRRSYNANYYRENSESMRLKARAWRAANHDRILAANRERAAAMRGAESEKGITVRALRQRDGDTCSYCDCELMFERTNSYEPNKASVDHVVPLVKGGAHTWDNVVIACLRCNIRKRDRNVDEWQAVREHRGANLHSRTA